MIEFDSLWGEPDEPVKGVLDKVTSKPKNDTKKVTDKTTKTKDTSAGFRMQLGTCRRRGKDGTQQTVPILLAKDPLCWILRIGSNQTYPTTLLGVFQTVAQQEALDLRSDATIEDLIEDQRGIEERIKEMGRLLDQRIRGYIMKNSKKK